MTEVLLDETVVAGAPGAMAHWHALERLHNEWTLPDLSRHYRPSDFASRHWYDVTDFGAVADGPFPSFNVGTPKTTFATTVAAGSNGVLTNALAFLNGTGVLSVAAVSTAGESGVLKVTQGSSVARFAYTNVSGSTFTGCKLINGVVFTMATGNAVASASTDNTAAFVAAFAACARTGGVVHIPAGLHGSYVISGKIPVYSFTSVIFDSWASCVVLADNALIGGRDASSFDVGMFELATASEHQVNFGGWGWGRICGTKNRQIGHSSSTIPWTLRAVTPSVTSSTTDLNIAWNETLAALPPAPFPVRLEDGEVVVLQNYDLAARTGVLQTGSRGRRNTTPAVHSAGGTIKVEIAAVWFDMTTDTLSQRLEQHRVSKLHVEQISGNGVHVNGMDASGNQHMHECWVTDISGHVVDGNTVRHHGSDGKVDKVISGQSGREGIVVLGGNTQGRGNKCYNSGRLVPAMGYAGRFSGSRTNDFGIEGQDNKADCIIITGNSHVIDVLSDANGQAIADGCGALFSGAGANNNTVHLQNYDRHDTASGLLVQAWAGGFVNGAIDNKLFFSNRTVLKGDIFGDPTGNYLHGDGRGGQQKPGLGAISGGAYTTTLLPHPDRGERFVLPTLAANLTIGKPTNRSLEPGVDLGDGGGFGPCYQDQEITFIVIQDATGGRTVTLNAVFKEIGTPGAWLDLGAGKRSVFHAVCLDATTWVQLP